MARRNETTRSKDLSDLQIGRSVRAARLQRKLSQSDLAQAVGVTLLQLRDYERGFDHVEPSRLKIIAKHLGITSAELMAMKAPKYLPRIILDAVADQNNSRVLRAYQRLTSHAVQMQFVRIFEAIADVNRRSD